MTPDAVELWASGLSYDEIAERSGAARGVVVDRLLAAATDPDLAATVLAGHERRRGSTRS